MGISYPFHLTHIDEPLVFGRGILFCRRRVGDQERLIEPEGRAVPNAGATIECGHVAAEHSAADGVRTADADEVEHDVSAWQQPCGRLDERSTAR
jgi:hypothetical protein